VIAAKDIIGCVLPVRIARLDRYSLLGEIVSPTLPLGEEPASSHVTIGA